ncbi:hypothetical protein SprV_0401553500 [Sparganum proliferum]
MQDARMVGKAEETQGYASRNEWKNFFVAIKIVHVPQLKELLLFSEPTAVPYSLRRGKFCSDGLSNSEASSTVPSPSPTPPSSVCLRAVQQPSSGKAPRSDAIPAGIYEHRGLRLMDHLTALFQEMWRPGEVLQDFKEAKMVPALRQPSKHPNAEHRREDLRSHPSQLSEQPHRARSSAGKPVRLSPSSWDH